MNSPPPRPGTRLARKAGLLSGGVLLIWAGLNHYRWPTATVGVWTESTLLAIYGLLLLLPYQSFKAPRLFRCFFTLLLLFTLGFAFLLVIDFMLQARLAEVAGKKPDSPALFGVLLMGAASQLPTLLFARHPQWLD